MHVKIIGFVGATYIELACTSKLLRPALISLFCGSNDAIHLSPELNGKAIIFMPLVLHCPARIKIMYVCMRIICPQPQYLPF